MRLIKQMPSLYRQRLQLPLSEKISKRMRRRWSISGIKIVLQISAYKESIDCIGVPLPRS
jgi:hypothetical protein